MRVPASQIRIRALRVAVAKDLPSGLTATAVTKSPLPVNSVRSRPVATSHTIALVSSPPLISVVPSALKATARTACS